MLTTLPQAGVYAVTGADGPLGVASTAALISHGATVIMGCANVERGRMLAAKMNEASQMQTAVCSDVVWSARGQT